jgi:hypothetical protein
VPVNAAKNRIAVQFCMRKNRAIVQQIGQIEIALVLGDGLFKF